MTKPASLFLNELRRTAVLWWSYRLSAISSIVIYAIIFPLLMVIFQNLASQHGATYGPTQQLSSLIGFLVWNLCMKVMAAIPQMVEDEASVGTLENVIASPLSPLTTLVMRTCVLCVRYAIETALLGLALGLLLKLPIVLSPAAVLVILLTLAGACGVGVALAGLALVYKSVGSIAGVVANLALLVSGALVPINALGSAFVVLKFLFPTTWGIDMLRQVMIGGYPVGWLSAEFSGLILQTVLLIGAGALVFQACLSKAKMQGSLSTY